MKVVAGIIAVPVVERGTTMYSPDGSLTRYPVDGFMASTLERGTTWYSPDGSLTR